MKKNFLIASIAILAIVVAFVVVSGQGGIAQGFGFENNIQHRKSADAESVMGCMQSCQDMLAGWLEMNPDSPNYVRQGEKIEAKAQQCLSMNELAGFPFSEEEILASCGLESRCAEVSEGDVRGGACTDVSFIEEANLPQCCGFEGPQGGRTCGADQEWVVGVAAFPTCYIPGS